MTISANKKQYLLNILSSYGGSIMSALVGIISAPISLSYWQIEKYGVWAIITSMSAYLSASGIGVDTACGILMTKSPCLKDKEWIFRRSLRILIASSVFFAALFLAVTFAFPDWLKVLGKMSVDVYAEARICAIIFIIGFFINMPFGAVANAIGAYQKIYLNNFLNAFAPLLSLGALLLTVSLKLGMIPYAVLANSIVIVLSLCRIVILGYSRKEYSALSRSDPATSDEREGSYRNILGTGLNLMFYSMALMLSSNIGNFIISNKIDAAHVAPYSLALKLFSLAFMFIATTIASASPIIGKELSRGNWDWIKRAHGSLLIVGMFMGGALWIGGILFLKPIITVWVGPVGYPGLPTVVLLGAYYFLYSFEYFNNIFCNALNYTRNIGIISWAEAIVTIGVMCFAVDRLGVAGVPAGLAAGVLLVSFWAFPVYVKKKSGKQLVYGMGSFAKMMAIVIVTVLLAMLLEYLMAESLMKILTRLLVLGLYSLTAFVFFKEEFLDVVYKNRRL